MTRRILLDKFCGGSIGLSGSRFVRILYRIVSVCRDPNLLLLDKMMNEEAALSFD